MRTFTTRSGTQLETDGDVLAVIEAVSRDLIQQRQLDYGFEDVERELQFLVMQLTEDELRVYLKESLFMSFNRFESERMMALVQRAKRTEEGEHL